MAQAGFNLVLSGLPVQYSNPQSLGQMADEGSSNRLIKLIDVLDLIIQLESAVRASL